MGRRGPLPSKRPQGHRPLRELSVVEGGKVEPPKAPARLLKVTKDRWDAYWRSDVAGVATEADMPAIERLFDWMDQWERAMRSVRKVPLVKGSTGQLVESPFVKIAGRAEQAIARLEGELGLTPMARQRLGIAIGDAAQSLASITAMFTAEDDPAPVDPRFAGAVDVEVDG